MQFSLSSISKPKAILAGTMLVIFCGVGIASTMFKEMPKPLAVPVMVINTSSVTLAGRGDLPPLNIAMQHDARLKEMVAGLEKAPSVDIFSKEIDVDLKVAEILFRWAEADMAPKASYGPYIDARVAAFLRKSGAMPASFMQGVEIPIKDATNLTQLWFKVFEHYRIRLLAQTAGKGIYDGGVKYNSNNDTITVNAPISPTFIKSFEDELQTATNSGEQMRAFLDFVDMTKGFSTLTEKEQDLIMSVEVKKSASAEHAVTTVGSGMAPSVDMPGKDKLPPVNATP